MKSSHFQTTFAPSRGRHLGPNCARTESNPDRQGAWHRAFTTPSRSWLGRHSISRPRRGSALMVVMVLMGMLALLGVIFYTFAAQERSNAAYYSDAAKNLGEPSLTADALFDWALEQIIVGTDRRLTNSMLWGSRHSMLSNSLGFGFNAPGDLHPFNGEGVNLIYDSNGNVAVDQNRNGVPDDGTSMAGSPPVVEPDNRFLLDYMDGPAAYKQFDSGERQVFNGPRYFPQTDVGYTYPDINNVFLTYVGKIRDQNGTVHQVVKPAYLVPALLRSPIGGISAPLIFEDTNFNGVLDAGEDTNGNGRLDDWTVNPMMASRVMRGHPNHIYVPATGIPSSPSNRYLTDAEAVSLIGPSAHGFPFHPMDPTYNTATGIPGPVYMKGQMGAYTSLSANPANDAQIQFDYDNDGDGINESILMDLDFPPQQDSNGKLFVPLFLITIHDLDALMNLNVHGNLAKILLGPNDIGGPTSQANTPVSNTANPFGFSNAATPTFYYISQSNLGLAPSEVNPLWALNARPGTDNGGGSTLFSATSQYAQFYGNPPTALGGANPVWGETANMELAWAKIGRLNFSGGVITDLLPGVYGEQYYLYSAKTNGTLANVGGHFLPRPGVSLQDDNGDLNEGQDYAPFFQHPMDYTGLGTYLSLGSPKAIGWSTAVGPNQWITYTGYGTNSTTPANSNVFWGQFPIATLPLLQTPELMFNSVTQGLGDDPNEISWYTLQSAFDNVLTPDEMLYLNLNNSEIDRLNINSRLSNLLPFNFAKTTTDNSRGAVIRRKFTTETNDRKSFGLPTSIRALGAAAAGANVQALLSANYLGQEYGLDSTSFTYKFPPQFGTIPRFQTTAMSEDPFRPHTRTLLEVELNSQQSRNRLQRKLSLNQYLANDLTGQLTFRNLTQHPADPGASVVTTTPGFATYPPTTAAGLEYWARNDRQKMARDIYVLLYLTAHGDDAVNTATTSNAGNAIYTDAQMREMAQFAVNLVDEMDRDNVVTRFEYDKDLSDGWNLDDDPYGTLEAPAYGNGNANFIPAYPNDSATRGEVFGIERLDMSISESLVIRAVKSTSGADYPQTNYNEGTNDRYFFYVELRNIGPMPITFNANETWQVVLRQEATGGSAFWERRLSLKDTTVTIYPTTDSGTNYPYVIGSSDSNTAATALNRSTFAVDVTGGSSPKQIVPNRPMGSPVPQCDLDLIEVPVPSNVFRIEDELNNDVTATSGAMLSAFTGATPVANIAAGATIKVLLRRRAHPTRSMVTATDNPWVEVDSMMLQSGSGFGTYTLTGASPPAALVASQLTNIVSRERPQPFEGVSEGVNTGTTNGNSASPNPPTLKNSFGQQNSLTTTTPFTLWQQHFDRNFASLMDLLRLPVFGPHQLTMLTHGATLEPPDTQHNNLVSSGNWTVGGVPYQIAVKSAVAKFAVPEDPSNTTNPSPTPATNMLNNRWHRLLEFLEVPTRTNVNLGVGTDLTIPRVPGRMNLNMMRYPEVYAGLLDDSRLTFLNLLSSNTNAVPAIPPDPDAPSLDDNTGENVGPNPRDWWREFLKSRDPYDPYIASTQSLYVPLPGLPSSRLLVSPDGTYPPDARPFRNIADVGYTTNTVTPGIKHPSVADTILRSLPMDSTLPAGTSQRRLLEVGNQTEHQNGTVDPYIRDRLLSKISQNTTTRSNCFGVFISVKYFSAAEQNGAIRIGGPLNGTPTPEHRGFFVVDRSKLENGQTSYGPTYNFRSFVDYRKTLQTQ